MLHVICNLCFPLLNASASLKVLPLYIRPPAAGRGGEADSVDSW